MQIKPRSRKRRERGLYEWWSWLKELSRADLFRFKFPPNTYTQMLPCQQRARDGLLITIDFFLFSPLLSSSLLYFPSYLSIYVLTSSSSSLYIYTYIRVEIYYIYIYLAFLPTFFLVYTACAAWPRASPTIESGWWRQRNGGRLAKENEREEEEEEEKSGLASWAVSVGLYW